MYQKRKVSLWCWSEKINAARENSGDRTLTVLISHDAENFLLVWLRSQFTHTSNEYLQKWLSLIEQSSAISKRSQIQLIQHQVFKVQHLYIHYCLQLHQCISPLAVFHLIKALKFQWPAEFFIKFFTFCIFELSFFSQITLNLCSLFAKMLAWAWLSWVMLIWKTL